MIKKIILCLIFLLILSALPANATDDENFLGIIQDGEFYILTLGTEITIPTRVTGMPMYAASLPESQEFDLTIYEGQVIMVNGYDGGGWIYSAEIIDQAGPILTEVVLEVYEVDIDIADEENGDDYFSFEHYLGYVANGEFSILSPYEPFPYAPRLTGIAMYESRSPETMELDLFEYEGRVIMVEGHDGGGWIYSAVIIDEAGPILTMTVLGVFGYGVAIEED